MRLRALSSAPFERHSDIDLKPLSLKTGLLFSSYVSYCKHVGDLTSLSVNPACMQFAPGDSVVVLQYVLTPSTCPKS